MCSEHIIAKIADFASWNMRRDRKALWVYLQQAISFVQLQRLNSPEYYCGLPNQVVLYRVSGKHVAGANVRPDLIRTWIDCMQLYDQTRPFARQASLRQAQSQPTFTRISLARHPID